MRVCTNCTSSDRFLECVPSACVAGLNMANQSAPSFFSSGGTVAGSTLRSTGIGAIEPDEPDDGSVAMALDSWAPEEDAVGVGGYGCGPEKEKQ